MHLDYSFNSILSSCWTYRSDRVGVKRLWWHFKFDLQLRISWRTSWSCDNQVILLYPPLTLPPILRNLELRFKELRRVFLVRWCHVWDLAVSHHSISSAESGQTEVQLTAEMCIWVTESDLRSASHPSADSWWGWVSWVTVVSPVSVSCLLVTLSQYWHPVKAFIVSNARSFLFIFYILGLYRSCSENWGKEEKNTFVLARALVGSQIYENIREPYWGLRVDDYYLRPGENTVLGPTFSASILAMSPSLFPSCNLKTRTDI